jgi:hypothetical protein
MLEDPRSRDPSLRFLKLHEAWTSLRLADLSIAVRRFHIFASPLAYPNVPRISQEAARIYELKFGNVFISHVISNISASADN